MYDFHYFFAVFSQHKCAIAVTFRRALVFVQHGFIMYKMHRWAKVQVQTLVQHAKNARQSFNEELRSVLDDMYVVCHRSLPWGDMPQPTVVLEIVCLDTGSQLFTLYKTSRPARDQQHGLKTITGVRLVQVMEGWMDERMHGYPLWQSQRRRHRCPCLSHDVDSLVPFSPSFFAFASAWPGSPTASKGKTDNLVLEG